MKYFLFILLLISAVPVQSQQSISADARSLIDSALSVFGMTKHDCAMPPDYGSRDVHRMPFHDSLFVDPFAAFDISRECAQSSVVASIHSATTRLGIASTTYPPKPPTNITTALELASAIQTIIERMEDNASPARIRWKELPHAVDLCDSLWMSESDDAELSLYESTWQARASRTRAEEYFNGVVPTLFEDVIAAGIEVTELLESLDVSSITTQNRDTPLVLTTSIGRVAIGTSGNDVYTEHYAIIVDVGGDDTYRLPHRTKSEVLSNPNTVIVDLAGNDVYVAGDYELGSSITGIGVLFDASGDDVYSAGDFSLGCGMYGFGLVRDGKGADTYLGGQNTQGAGFFGVGVLADDDGHDTYRCHAQGQGFGATRGYGALFDNHGNDQYLSASPFLDVLRYEAHFVTFTQGAALGYRPLASGGIGVLADRSGNDVYVTDIYGQGTAYWYALGALFDDDGEDRYQAYQYAQGSGVHLATGLLHDKRGSDVYVSHGVSQGCGHDIALGALVDEHGDDAYVVESLSLGGGNANAVSVFVDRIGNDSYVAQNTSNTMGYSDFRRYTGMVGLFADGGGNDTYGEPTRNNTQDTKSTFGVFLDANIVSDSTPSTPEPTYSQMPLSSTVDSLFIQASAAPLKYQNNVVPARDKIADLGSAALPPLLPYLSTSMPRERLALEYILPKIWKTDSTRVDGLLLDSLDSDVGATLALCCTVAGKTKSKALVEKLHEMLTSPEWKKRRIAVQTLGEIGDTTSTEFLAQCVMDTEPLVRARVGYALGILGSQGSLEKTKSLLRDPEAVVRFTTVEGLRRGRELNFNEVLPLLQTPSYNELVVASRLLTKCDTSAASVAAFNAWYATLTALQKQAVDVTYQSIPGDWQTAFVRPE